MSALPQRYLPGDEVTIACETEFDPAAYFDQWLAALSQPVGEFPLVETNPEDEIFLESRIGSNCEVNFEGLLRFDGYSLGNVVSPAGTLVLSKRGRIEADIDVGVAIIDGFVTGNIIASERVVLESDARVKGQIFTPSLSMHLGALLDGDCLLITQAEAAAQTNEVEPAGFSPFFLTEDLALSNELPLELTEEPAEELEEFLLSA